MLPDSGDVVEAAIGSIVASVALAVVLGLVGYVSTSEISRDVKQKFGNGGGGGGDMHV